jgi:hypothetical protein
VNCTVLYGISQEGIACAMTDVAWPLFPSALLRIDALLINRYYYGFRIIMSINKAAPSPLALREGFHVVLLRALAERLQGRDWALKGGIDQILAVPPETIT